MSKTRGAVSTASWIALSASNSTFLLELPRESEDLDSKAGEEDGEKYEIDFRDPCRV